MFLLLSTMDTRLMADPPLQRSKPRNPNWGGRREGSGRKKSARSTPTLSELPKVRVDTTCTYCCISSFFFFSSLSTTDTSQTKLPVNTPIPTRGFFAPRNRLPDLSPTLYPSVGTSDREQGATNGV